MKRRDFILTSLSSIAAMGPWPVRSASAASFPNRPLRLIVPFPPGGGTDVVARALAAKASERLGQQIIVENKSGGMGAIAQRELAKESADGHTIVFDSMAIVVFPHLMREPLYNPVKELDPVGETNSFPFVIIANPKVPIQTVADLIAHLRTRPDSLNIAVGGATTRLAAELFKLTAGVDMRFIPYRGGAPTMTALISGESDIYFGDIPTVIPHIRSGRVKAIAITSRKRSFLLPDTSTVAEAGLPNYEFSSWNGLYVKAGTQPDVIASLHTAFQAALQEPSILEMLRLAGSEPSAKSSAEFRSYTSQQFEFWKDIIQRSGMPMIS